MPRTPPVEKALASYKSEVDGFLPVVISSMDEYEYAANELRRVRLQRKALEEERKKATRPMDEAKAVVMGFFSPVVNKYTAYETYLTQAMGVWTRDEEKKRRALEAQLRDEQEQQRVEAAGRAAELAYEGKTEQAMAVLDAIPPVPVVILEQPKVTGLSSREIHKATVENMDAFLLWVIDNDRYDLIQPNQSALNELARTSQGNIKVSGVRFDRDMSFTVRR